MNRRKNSLKGYGVEMVLKRTDYLAVDDRETASVDGEWILAGYGRDVVLKWMMDQRGKRNRSSQPLQRQRTLALGIRALLETDLGMSWSRHLSKLPRSTVSSIAYPRTIQDSTRHPLSRHRPPKCLPHPLRRRSPLRPHRHQPGFPETLCCDREEGCGE